MSCPQACLLQRHERRKSLGAGISNICLSRVVESYPHAQPRSPVNLFTKLLTDGLVIAVHTNLLAMK